MRSRLSRRDAEAFAAAVDGRVQGGPEPVFTDRLRELVDVADLVRESSASTARRDFVVDLRAELMAAAADELSSTAPRRDPVRVAAPYVRRRLTAAASAFVVAGGTFGLVAASAQAVPGDMLYPVKRATERAELWLHDGAAEGRALLDHANTRLGEVETLTADRGQDTDDLISETLSDFTAEANAGGTLLLESYRDTSSAGEVEDLRAFVTESAGRLADLAGSLPRSAAAAYADAADAVNGLGASAVRACPTCAGGNAADPVDPDLTASVADTVDRAGDTSQATAPTSPRQAADRHRTKTAGPSIGIDLPDVSKHRPDRAVDTKQRSTDSDGPVAAKPDHDSGPVEEVGDTADDTTDEPAGKLRVRTSVKPVDALAKPVDEVVDGLIENGPPTP